MLKLITVVSGLILLGFLRWRASAEFIYENIFEYAQNLTAVYEDPSHVFGEDLLRTSVFYLDELMELEEALEDKDEDEGKKALKVLAKLYNSGGPKHTKQIPYGRFIDAYNWKSDSVDDLARYIEMTSQTWDRVLKYIDVLAKGGKIKVQDQDGHMTVL